MTKISLLSRWADSDFRTIYRITKELGEGPNSFDGPVEVEDNVVTHKPSQSGKS